MSKFKLACEDNSYIHQKLENLRAKLLKSNNEQKAVNAKRILAALEKFPFPLTSGKLAEDFLQGVGPWWASRIDKWLLSKPIKRKASPVLIPEKRLHYSPPFNTPEWTALACMAKSEVPAASYDINYLINHHFPSHSLDPLQSPDSTLDFLCKIGLLSEEEGLYSLTQNGAQAAAKLLAECPTPHKAQIQSEKFDPDSWLASDCEPSSETDCGVGNFSIVLIVDSAERLSTDFDAIFLRLCGRDLAVERKKLWIGDYQWVCRYCLDGQQVDIALNYIVERKTADDLAHSIIDFRYEEQKIRLKKSGFNIIYLLEGRAPQKMTKIKPSTLTASLLSTNINYGFRIKITSDSVETLNWLARFTAELYQEISGWTHEKIVSFPLFEDFYQSTNPNYELTVKEVFGKQLRSLDKIGEHSTLAILNSFPTPLEFYNKITEAASKGKRALGKFLKEIKLKNGNTLNKNTRDAMQKLFLGN